jgi:hypothetical protein
MAHAVIPKGARHRYLLIALVDKWAEIAAEAEEHRSVARSLRAKLDALAHTIGLFDPTIDLRKVRGRRRRANRGQITPFLHDVLRVSQIPLNAEELTRAVMIRRSLDPEDRVLWLTTIRRVRWCLSLQARRGLVKIVQDERGQTLWERAE